MSTEMLWSQANHTLTIIGHQKPNRRHLHRLHSGYLAALVEGVIIDNHLPSLPEFRKLLGLEIPQTIVVDYNQSYDDMLEACMFSGFQGSLQDSFPVKGNGVVEFDFRYFDFDPKLTPSSSLLEKRSTSPPSDPSTTPVGSW